MKALFRRIVSWFLGLFRRNKPEPDMVTATGTDSYPTPPQKFEMKMPDKIATALVGPEKKSKHPLHYSHFGTFSPLKPVRGWSV